MVATFVSGKRAPLELDSGEVVPGIAVDPATISRIPRTWWLGKRV